MWYFLFPAHWLLNLNWISPNSKMLPMMCWWCCKLCLFWWWWLFLWSGFVMEEHETIAEGSHQWTSTDFEIHPIWMKLCSIDTYYNMVPQQISQFLSGFKVTRRIFTDFKLVNFHSSYRGSWWAIMTVFALQNSVWVFWFIVSSFGI